MIAKIENLEAMVARLDRAAVAVSGGIDSMTLAHIVHRRLRDRATMVHAGSAAVPASATARVRAHARDHGWNLREIDAGEFDDPNYRANPVDRCFFCKSNLYRAMRSVGEGSLLSGTNCDDLGEYRPGLRAAEAFAVRHPFVEAGLTKRDIRAIARTLGLHDLADLPASPCLASRIETGLEIEAAHLTLIARIEDTITTALAARGVTPTAVRCRMRHSGPAIELDRVSLAAVDDALIRQVRAVGFADTVRFEPYRRGSAFLTDGISASSEEGIPAGISAGILE